MRPIGLLILLTACYDDRIEAAYDRDGDGLPSWEVGGPDCDDENPAVYPGAEEICGNNLDDDCSGFIDDAGVGDVTFYVDLDGDGFPGTTPQSSCSAPDDSFASLSIGADCNDGDDRISPSMAEVWYDGIDQDCDGNDTDADGDGWSGGPNGDDCDDDDSSVNPGQQEVCNNGVDDDCDGGPGPCEMTGVVLAEDVVIGIAGPSEWVSFDRDDGQPVVLFKSTRNLLSFDAPLPTLIGQLDARRWPLRYFFDPTAVDYADVDGDGSLDEFSVTQGSVTLRLGSDVEAVAVVPENDPVFDTSYAPVAAIHPGQAALVYTQQEVSGQVVASVSSVVDLGADHVPDSISLAPGQQVAGWASQDDRTLLMWSPDELQLVNPTTGAVGARWQPTSGVVLSVEQLSPFRWGALWVDGSGSRSLVVFGPLGTGEFAVTHTIESSDDDEVQDGLLCDLTGDGTEDLLVGVQGTDESRDVVLLQASDGGGLLVSDADVRIEGVGAEGLACGEELRVFATSDVQIGAAIVVRWSGL